MDIGMLWYDDDPKRPLADKVARAVDYYKAKYGSVPTICFVNPATLKDAPETAAGVQIRPARNVMVDHFWLGVGEIGGNGNGKAQSNGRSAPVRSNGNSRGQRAGRSSAASSAGRAG